MPTILVVDDRPTNRELLRTILQYGGHCIIEATDGREALDVARAERPALIISDILMPTMDGFEFVRRLRDDPVVGKTPVVFSSAHYLSHEATVLAHNCGVDHILTKPVEPDVILRTVDLVLARTPPTGRAPPSEFSREHVRVLTDKLADKVKQLEVANQRLTALNELGRMIGSERSPRTLLEAFCRDARGILGARFGSIGLVDEAGRTRGPLVWSGVTDPSGIDPRLVAGPGTLIERCLADGRPYRAAEIGAEAVGLTAVHPPVRFAMCAPITSPTGTHGWVCFTDKLGVGQFGEDDEEVLFSLSAQLGRAYESIMLLARLQEHAAELKAEIAHRKRTEGALRESKMRYRQTFENAAVGIANVGIDGTWLEVNQRLCEILGYSRSELLKKNFQEITHPEDLPFNLDRFTALMRGEIDKYRLEKRYLHKDGHAIWVDLTAAVQRDQAGNPAYCIAIIEDIGARKRAEQALRESEARLRRTVEQAPFPIMVHAEDGEVVHLSQAWLDLTGYAREEIGTIAAWTERAYGEQKDLVRADIDELYALDRAVDEGEYQIRTADGRMRVWTFSSAPLGSDDRGRRLVVSMAADVTERKEAERARQESEVRMRALLDASQDEILLLSTQGEVLAINKAAERRLARRTVGLDPMGAHLDRLLPRDQAEQRLAIVRQVAATATLAHWEVQIRARWFEFWFYPVLQVDRPVTEVAVYAREITEQKKAQAELSKLSQAIQQSPMSVIITDRDGTIEYVNPEFTKVTGYTPTEAIGRNPRILQSGHTAPELYADLWRTISAGGVWRGEFLNKMKNGELFWELASIGPVKDEDCRIINFVAVKEDITERKEIEDQLRQSQKMQAVGQLTGGIAHDFNNLLAIIIGNLQLLGERVSGDAKTREYLDDALWSARRGGELTHRLLAFARKQPLKPTVIDLNDVVRGMSELLRRTLGASIRIEESLAPGLWKALADRGELERALVNLAVNARDAMHSTGTLTLETRNAALDEHYAEQFEEVRAGEYALLAVTDTGTGMSPEVMSRVFEPFFTTKEVGQGSGLGLSMVFGFVKQSGGHINIYSRVGHGTSVKLYLPRVPSSPEGREECPPEAAAAGGFGNPVVLVVEDEAKLRKVAVKMLEKLGVQSLQAENAKDALELLANAGHVDVLFTDIELPGGMNGTDLAEAVHERDPTIKVLFTTGYAREAVLHERWLDEKVPWLLKPYSHIELARELKALLAPAVH